MAYVDTVEFQKRGLPHTHSCIHVRHQDKPFTPQQVDKCISAELPDPNQDPRLFKAVSDFMIHGPCGVVNPDSKCMENGKCTKGFPKPFCEQTTMGDDGFPRYRRRDNGVGFWKQVRGQQFFIDNRWVVPHNPYLLCKYQTHMNVEICSTVRSIKYIYKYINKGHDVANISITPNQNIVNYDEIQAFENSRYVSSIEGMWHILNLPMREKSHSIYRLPVHLPFQQMVTYQPNANLMTVLENNKKTMLTEWFMLNQNDNRARQLLYCEIPSHYVWQKRAEDKESKF